MMEDIDAHELIERLRGALASAIGLLAVPPGQVDEEARRSIVDYGKTLLQQAYI